MTAYRSDLDAANAQIELLEAKNVALQKSYEEVHELNEELTSQPCARCAARQAKQQEKRRNIAANVLAVCLAVVVVSAIPVGGIYALVVWWRRATPAEVQTRASAIYDQDLGGTVTPVCRPTARHYYLCDAPTPVAEKLICLADTGFGGDVDCTWKRLAP